MVGDGLINIDEAQFDLNEISGNRRVMLLPRLAGRPLNALVSVRGMRGSFPSSPSHPAPRPKNTYMTSSQFGLFSHPNLGMGNESDAGLASPKPRLRTAALLCRRANGPMYATVRSPPPTMRA